MLQAESSWTPAGRKGVGAAEGRRGLHSPRPLAEGANARSNPQQQDRRGAAQQSETLISGQALTRGRIQVPV